MALDSLQKRMSAIHAGSPWRGSPVDAAETGLTVGNRMAAAGLYSGIEPPVPRRRTVHRGLTQGTVTRRNLQVGLERRNLQDPNVRRRH